MQDEKTTNVIFSDVLKTTMDLRGINQPILGKATGLSQAAINNYCNGRIPKGEELYRLARALDVSMEYLLTGVEHPDDEPIDIAEDWRARAQAAERKLDLLRACLEDAVKKISS